MSIAVNDLSKIYGAQKAVNGISFTVNRGEVVGFLGPNGAGKSTTMKMITGYLKADGGTIAVGGVNVSENSIATKKMIGYLPEANPLYPEMYVREYLQFVGNVHKVEGLSLKVKAVIETVGLSMEANKKIGQLSKGYKQRVGLAAALIHDPEVLILDEPTSGLDPNQIADIRAVIKNLGKEKTVLFSSHILQEVEAICDRVIIINKGSIVANDTLSNLQKASPSLQSIEIRFREDVDIELLRNLNGVSMVTSKERSTFSIQCSNADTVKKHLLQLAIDKNLNIITLQSVGQSLEEVFRELTAQHQ